LSKWVGFLSKWVVTHMLADVWLGGWWVSVVVAVGTTAF
jgi:hypothetical protein